MDKSELSKRKYIYKIYHSYRDDRFHIEEYPVIYANSEYVYFKVANKQKLQCIAFRFVMNDISGLDLTREGVVSRGVYTWCDPRKSYDDFDQVLKRFRRKQYERLIENEKSEIKRLEYRLRYAYALAELHKLESEKENV